MNLTDVLMMKHSLNIQTIHNQGKYYINQEFGDVWSAAEIIDSSGLQAS